MTVRNKQDGYRTCDRMCAQLLMLLTIAELTVEPGQQGVFMFDNSTGHGAYKDKALLANHIVEPRGGAAHSRVMI